MQGVLDTLFPDVINYFVSVHGAWENYKKQSKIWMWFRDTVKVLNSWNSTIMYLHVDFYM